jgi:hypothetical protein
VARIVTAKNSNDEKDMLNHHVQVDQEEAKRQSGCGEV